MAVPDYVYLLAHPATIRKWLAMGVRSKMGEYWGLVHGNFPANPEFHDTPDGSAGLIRPTAIFQGVKRPLHDGIVAGDGDILIYVTKPDRNYSIRHAREGDVIEEAVRPENAVFTTFVTFQPDKVDVVRADMPKAGVQPIDGLVLFWEWTEASSIDPRLPFDFGTRYEERLL
jgi:hypothetical protein